MSTLQAGWVVVWTQQDRGLLWQVAWVAPVRGGPSGDGQLVQCGKDSLGRAVGFSISDACLGFVLRVDSGRGTERRPMWDLAERPLVLVAES